MYLSGSSCSRKPTASVVIALSAPPSQEHTCMPALHTLLRLSLSIFFICFFLSSPRHCLLYRPSYICSHLYPTTHVYLLAPWILGKHSCKIHKAIPCLMSFPAILMFNSSRCCPIHINYVFSRLIVRPCFLNTFSTPSALL